MVHNNYMVKIFLTLLIMISTAYAETRMKVVVIDTGASREQLKQPYMCKNGNFTVFRDNGIDTHGHGTNVIGLIVEKINAKKYCIVSIKFYDKHKAFSGVVNAIRSLRTAIKLKPTIVNLSMDGIEAEPEEYNLIETLLKNGAKISVAAGNYNQELTQNYCLIYPACYKRWFDKALAKNFYVIGARNVSKSDYGPLVDFTFDGFKIGTPKMSGTSQATAVFTSTLVSK
jgi:hypothetical protein